MSASPAPESSSSSTPINRHAATPVERQRQQLEKLLKDPAKPVFIPAPPKEKSIRAPRDMMKNVQGSSAGAGSGEFHVYKASRRREYERLKLMDEESQKEADIREFEEKKRQWEEQAEAKTAKNRAKRQKKKERAKNKTGDQPSEGGSGGATAAASDVPLKKRRLVNGQELVFKRPADDSDEDEDHVGPQPAATLSSTPHLPETDSTPPPVIEQNRIIIHEED
ncbi:PRKR-interacting protein 1 [Abortiporus biennis]